MPRRVLKRLSRGYFAGAGRPRTSTTRACVHEGLLLMRRADCILEANLFASKNSVKNRGARSVENRPSLQSLLVPIHIPAKPGISQECISLCLLAHCY